MISLSFKQIYEVRSHIHASTPLAPCTAPRVQSNKFSKNKEKSSYKKNKHLGKFRKSSTDRYIVKTNYSIIIILHTEIVYYIAVELLLIKTLFEKTIQNCTLKTILYKNKYQ